MVKMAVGKRKATNSFVTSSFVFATMTFVWMLVFPAPKQQQHYAVLAQTEQSGQFDNDIYYNSSSSSYTIEDLFCRQYDFDCVSCIENNCYWCPGNAYCSSIPYYDYDDIVVYISYYEERIVSVACETEEDWTLTTTCTAASATTISTTDNPSPLSFFVNDPLYDAQRWVHQLMNVENVWDIYGIKGLGIHIRINDMGVDINHPDIVGGSSNDANTNNINRFDIDSSCAIYEPLRSNTMHGTWAAIVAAGTVNNSMCSGGIAPEATLSSCNQFIENPDDAYALAGDNAIENVDISSNSWGFATCKTLYNRKLERQREQFQTRHLQQQQQSSAEFCPFQQTINITTDDTIINDICSICEFSSSFIELSRQCENTIIDYCSERLNFENNVVACTEFLELYADCDYNTVPQKAKNALEHGVQSGRNGLGIIYLFASGNDYNAGADVNFEGYMNTRYTISVGAVSKDGKHASYSTSGSALFVVGPGGDQDYLTNHVGCVPIGIGTSLSCPAVAGVVALILQSNYNLNWRDIQGILAATSIQTDPTHPSWTRNAANYHHNTLYGFGIPDAYEAVTVAKNWKTFGPELRIVANSTTNNYNIPIPDDPTTPVTSTITITNDDLIHNAIIDNNSNFIIESVYIYLDITHASRGDLNIILQSPSGTESIIHPSKRPENQLVSIKEWELMTVRAWGENPIGEWKLLIADESLGDIETCLDLPFSSTIGDGDSAVDLDCFLTEYNFFCFDGEVFESRLSTYVDPNHSNMSAVDACCICGGGQLSSAVLDQLHSWRLVIYGHEESNDDNDVGDNNDNNVDDDDNSLKVEQNLESITTNNGNNPVSVSVNNSNYGSNTTTSATANNSNSDYNNSTMTPGENSSAAATSSSANAAGRNNKQMHVLLSSTISLTTLIAIMVNLAY